MRLVQEVDVNTPQQPWFTEWFQAYLRSLWDLRNFGDVLKKVVRFMCEELQHERFKDKQPIMMMSILTVRLLVWIHVTLLNNPAARPLDLASHSSLSEIR